MDWLDERIEQLKGNAKSIRFSLTIILLAGFLIVLSLWLLTNALCVSWERLLLEDTSHLYFYEIFTWRPTINLEIDYLWPIRLLEAVRFGSIFIYCLLAIYFVADFFSKMKIQQPLLLMQSGMAKINQGDLNQPLYYEGPKEFTELIQEFDQLRQSLRGNQAEIKQLHQEQKNVNAAFSHDLRTPLAVIQNNVEIIEEFYGTGQLSKEQFSKSLTKIKNNILRLTDFSETMKTIQRLDEIQLNRKQQSLHHLIELVQDLGNSLLGAKFSFHTSGDISTTALIDLNLIMEIIENLLSNAKVYAKNSVEVTLQREGGYLFIFVKDDGPGFSKQELLQATQAYYSKDKAGHFGLGLTISEALVKKHGGVLELTNGVTNGAVVSATFIIN
ncbi:HAMP domain-containing sensor histidine kinase [Enterococcus sp. LJL90]